LAVSSVYVSWPNLSWDWRPDAFARWDPLIPVSSRLLKWIAPAPDSVRAGGRRQILFRKARSRLR
jgi:hypothetical protein